MVSDHNFMAHLVFKLQALAGIGQGGRVQGGIRRARLWLAGGERAQQEAWEGVQYPSPPST